MTHTAEPTPSLADQLELSDLDPVDADRVRRLVVAFERKTVTAKRFEALVADLGDVRGAVDTLLPIEPAVGCPPWCTEKHSRLSPDCCSDVHGVDVGLRENPGRLEASEVCVRLQRDVGDVPRVVLHMNGPSVDAEVYMPADKAAAVLQLLNHAVAQVTA